MAKTGEIVWLVANPLKYTYLREYTRVSCSSRFPVKKKLTRDLSLIVGYEFLSSEKTTGARLYNFRFWYMKTYDRDIEPEGIYKYNQPSEAVIPASIITGQESTPYKTPPELFNRWPDHMAQLRRAGKR